MNTSRRIPAGQSVAEAVADRLAAEILQSAPEGTSLPNEANLAAKYKVSRLTMREALKVLAGRKLVSLGRGRRAISTRPDGSAIADYLSATIIMDGRGLQELMEIRMGLEPLAAGLAAARISRAGLLAIRTALDGMRASLEKLDQTRPDSDPFNKFDLQFHEAIAAASGNRALSAIFEGLAPPLFSGMSRTIEGQRQRGQSRMVTLTAHQAILDAIASGNATDATSAMRRHLEETRVDVTFVLKGGINQ